MKNSVVCVYGICLEFMSKFVQYQNFQSYGISVEDRNQALVFEVKYQGFILDSKHYTVKVQKRFELKHKEASWLFGL